MSEASCGGGPLEGSGAVRLLLDPPQDGATNMAADDTLIDAVGRGASPATLRLYRWGPPCLSLGYFQSFAEVERLDVPRALKCEVVRRVTGGGAIIHDQELTYSLTLPLGHALMGDDPSCLYRRVHEVAIVSAELIGCYIHFRELDGPVEETTRKEREAEFLCFHRMHPLDCVTGGLKILGSAQRRTREAVLQHGSLITNRRYHQQRCLSLSMLAGRIITWEAAVEAFVAAWARVFPRFPAVAGEWTDEELAARWDAVKLHRSAAWVQRR